MAPWGLGSLVCGDCTAASYNIRLPPHLHPWAGESGRPGLKSQIHLCTCGLHSYSIFNKCLLIPRSAPGTVLGAGDAGVIPASWSTEFGEGGTSDEKRLPMLPVAHLIPSALTFAGHIMASWSLTQWPPSWGQPTGQARSTRELTFPGAALSP